MLMYLAVLISQSNSTAIDRLLPQTCPSNQNSPMLRLQSSDNHPYTVCVTRCYKYVICSFSTSVYTTLLSTQATKFTHPHTSTILTLFTVIRPAKCPTAIMCPDTVSKAVYDGCICPRHIDIGIANLPIPLPMG